MRYYGMDQDQALDTRMDVAQYLMERVRKEDDLQLLGLLTAIHKPQVILDAMKEKRKTKTTSSGFNKALAKLARLKGGDPAQNEALAQDIESRGHAAELLAKVKRGADGRNR